jgi:hypothetical protein
VRVRVHLQGDGQPSPIEAALALEQLAGGGGGGSFGGVRCQSSTVGLTPAQLTNHGTPSPN